MVAMSFLLLLLVPAVLLAFLWRFGRVVADPDPVDGPVDPKEADLVGTQIAAAERLRKRAAAAKDPQERASLIRLADEADADAEKLMKGFD
jgi:hypothetical protein